MSARAIANRAERLPDSAPDGPHIEEYAPPAIDEGLQAANRIESAAQEIQLLHAVLCRLDKNITAAAKRAVKQAGSWPLRLNSRRARQPH